MKSEMSDSTEAVVKLIIPLRRAVQRQLFIPVWNFNCR